MTNLQIVANSSFVAVCGVGFLIAWLIQQR